MEDFTETTGGEQTAEQTAPDWDNWENVDFSDVTDDGEDQPTEDPKADQQEESEKGTEDNSGDAEEAESPGADQRFTLKHLGETREVSRDEVIAYAQKGMDYDRIRQKLVEVTAERDSFSAAESEAQSFLKEMAEAAGMTVDQLIDNTRAQALAEKERIDVSVARGLIRNQKEAARLQREKDQLQNTQSEQNKEQERHSKAVQAFVEAYPGVDGKDIPQSVWDEYTRTGDLVNAYRAEENRQLKAQVESLSKKLSAQETNKKNKGRSTGSQQTAGKKEVDDPFLAAWYNGD